MKNSKKYIAIFLSCLMFITSNSTFVFANSFNDLNDTLNIETGQKIYDATLNDDELECDIDNDVAENDELFENFELSNDSCESSQFEENCEADKIDVEQEFENQKSEPIESYEKEELELDDELDEEASEKEEIETEVSEENDDEKLVEEPELKNDKIFENNDEVVGSNEENNSNNDDLENFDNSNIEISNDEISFDIDKDNGNENFNIENNSELEKNKEDILKNETKSSLYDVNDELLENDAILNEESSDKKSQDLVENNDKIVENDIQYDECEKSTKDDIKNDENLGEDQTTVSVEVLNYIDVIDKNNVENTITDILAIKQDEENNDTIKVIEEVNNIIIDKNVENKNSTNDFAINDIENIDEKIEIEDLINKTVAIEEVKNDKVLMGNNEYLETNSKVVNKIVIANNREIYYIGDVLDINVTAYYSDNTTKKLENSEYVVSGYNNEVIKTGLVVVISYTYNENTVTESFTTNLLAKPEGSGTSNDPFLMNSMTDMNYIVNKVASGETFDNKYFKVTDDINFDTAWKGIGAVSDDNDYTTNNGKYVLHFAGIIDGDNHTFTFEKGCHPLLNYARYTTVKNVNIVAPYMDGFALVANHGIDYWPSGKSSTTVDKSITIENVNIKSGSRFKNGGYIGSLQNVYGCGSAAKNIVEIKNCKVESDVIFGVDIEGNSNNQDKVGSFVGVACAHIENCESHAKVYGNNYVGGIAGYTGNSMTNFYVKNSKFYGEINASGNCVGGIIGGGFYATGMAAAPNANPLSVTNCYVDEIVTINGNNYIGGIIGAEEGITQAWDNKGFSAPVKNNYSLATLSAKENKAYIGGIIGYMASLDKVNDIQNNYYKADKDSIMTIGHIDKVWTTYENPKVVSGTEYGQITGAHSSCNRTDDPLGVDSAKIGRRATKEEIENGTILALLGKVVVNVSGGGKADFKDIKGYIYEKDIDEETKVWDVIKEALENNSYTYLGDGNYLMSMTDNEGHTLSGGDTNFGSWSGIMYEVNGEQPMETMSDRTVAIGDNIELFFSYAEKLTLSGNYKKNYSINSKFSTSNMTAQVLYYKNSWPQDIPDGYGTTIDVISFSGFNSSKLGKQTITASYGSASMNFVITVERNKKSSSGGSSGGGGGGGGGSSSSLQVNKTNGLNSVMYSKTNAKNVVVEKSNITLNSLLGCWKKDVEGDWLFSIDKNNESVVARQGIYTMVSVDEGTGLVLNDCYYFDENGKLQIGWIKNGVDNTYYYFETIKNSDMGKMARGWKQIGEKWYWFGMDGKLLVNSITPDGYEVNSEGEWFDIKNDISQNSLIKNDELKTNEIEKKGPVENKM